MDHKKKTCLFIAYWPPSNDLPVAASIRGHKIVSGLKKNGWQVVVISPEHGLSEKGFLEPDCLAIPTPKFAPSISLPKSDIEKSSPAKPPSELKKQVISFLRKAKRYLPSPMTLWWYLWRKKALTFAKKHNPDLILSTSPPPSTHFLARYLAKKINKPWIAEFRDLWSENLFESKKGVMRPIDRALEKWVLSHAKGIVTISDSWAKTQTQIHKKPVKVIRHCFLEDPFAQDQCLAKGYELNLPLKILFTGLVYPGKRMPTMFLDALTELIEKKLISDKEVQADFFAPNWLTLADWFKENYPQLVGVCKINPPVDHHKALAMQKKAHLLLTVEWGQKGDHGCVSGKMVEYLGAGRFILALVAGGGPDQAIINATGAGKAVTTKQDCSNVLFDFVGMARSNTLFSTSAYTKEEVFNFSCSTAMKELSDQLTLWA